MKTFAFIQKNPLSNVYGSFLHRYRKYDGVMEILKVSALFSGLVLCVFCYLYFINMASTRGYFLRQENLKLSAISFQSEIIKTKMLDYKQQNRDAINGSNFKREIVNINPEVVKIPSMVQLGMK